MALKSMRALQIITKQTKKGGLFIVQILNGTNAKRKDKKDTFLIDAPPEKENKHKWLSIKLPSHYH